MKFIKSVFVSILLVPLLVFAQNQVVLPNAGLTPESPFYFLDKFGEAMRTFFTFNPEGKARLQITYAGERVSEIKIILETKGIEAKGIEVAQGRLMAHLANAATIVTDQKSEGKDVSALAKELDDDFEGPKSALEQTFKDQKWTLKAQEKELKRKILDARRAGDTVQVESLVQQLGQVKAQMELLELKKEETEEALEREEERLEEEMEAKEGADKAIREAEEEKQEVLDEAVKENIIVPAETFSKFDALLVQAKSAFTAGNYSEAKRLGKLAEKSLDDIGEAIGELEDAKEKEEELKEEQEEKEREVKEEQEEQVKEEAEKEAEQSEVKQEKNENETREVEERLRNVEDGN